MSLLFLWLCPNCSDTKPKEVSQQRFMAMLPLDKQQRVYQMLASGQAAGVLMEFEHDCPDCNSDFLSYSAVVKYLAPVQTKKPVS